MPVGCGLSSEGFSAGFMVAGFVAFGMAPGPDERDLESFVADPDALLGNG